MQKFDNKICQNILSTSSWKNFFFLFFFWSFLLCHSKEKIDSQIVIIILNRKLPVKLLSLFWLEKTFQFSTSWTNWTSILYVKPTTIFQKKNQKTYLQNNSCPSVLSYQFLASLASRGEKSSIILTVTLVCPFSCFKGNHSQSNSGLFILVF